MQSRRRTEASSHTVEPSALAAGRSGGARAANSAAGSVLVDKMVGGSCAALGTGDQVFDANGNVVPCFPSTPDGVVAAALYELHRGERRTLASIVADPTDNRLDRGPLAAIEGHVGKKGSNDDAPGARPIGSTREEGQLGPISAYHAAISQDDAQPWCGAFVSFCYERAGIASGDLGYSIAVPSRLAGSAANGHVGEYYRMTGAVKGGQYGGALQRGLHDAHGSLANATARYEHASVRSAMDLDIRPGDAFWLEHTSTTGHVGLIVGVHKTPSLITLATIEGNVSNKVDSKTRTIEVGANGVVSSQIKGWGRAAQLAAARAPALGGPMPSWMEGASARNDKDDEASTR